MNKTLIPKLACITMVVAFGSQLARGDFDIDQLKKQLDPLLKSHQGDVSVVVKHLPSGASYEYFGDRPMGTASLIKWPLLMALYEQVQAGEAKLDELITLDEEDKVPGSGILTTHFSPGAKLPLRDVAQLMIVYSDNTATNLVIDRVGLAATNDLMGRLGCEQTRLNSKVYRRDTSNDLERSQKYGLGSTTASEMVKLAELLYTNQFVDAATSQAVLAHLHDCDDRSKVPRFLPSGVRVAHKTGAVNDIRTDAGLIELPEGAVLFCVLTSNNKDRSWTSDNAAELLAAEVGRVAYHFFAGDKQPDTAPAVVTLKIGSNGTLVEGLQRTLNARLTPSPGIAVDGDFGPNTESAVRAFEQQQKLEVDGIVDREFWLALGPLVSEEQAIVDAEAEATGPTAKQPRESLDGPPLTTAKAWIAVDAATGQRVAGDNDQVVRDPASTTKIMTAYLVLSLAESQPEILDETITFSQTADDTSGSTSALRAGEIVTVGDLLYGLLLPSGNDASVALAEHFGGRPAGQPRGAGFDDFIAAMNQRAKDLGMQDTGYRNPHGLTAAGHVTTARDLATLATAAMRLPKFREVVATARKQVRVDSTAGYQRDVVWRNTNRLLDREGYLGIKTGTTGPAGACLVACGERDGRELIVVVLGATSSDARYTDSRNLYRWLWNQPSENE